MKRVLGIVLAFMMVFAFTSCKGKEKKAGTSGDAKEVSVLGDVNGDGVFTVAYIAVTTTLAPYPIDILNQFQAYADKHEWELEVYDGNGDVNTQTEQVASVISDDIVDLVVLFPVDSAAAVTYVKDFSEAGIDVITITSDVKAEGQSMVYCYVGPDQKNGLVGPGANYILEHFKAGSNYVILSGWEAQYDYIVREASVNEFFTDAGYNQLAVKYCGASRDTAYEEMSALLVANKDIDFVFALSDEFALGGVQAIKEAGYKPGDITVVSLEAFIDSMEQVKDGWIQLTVTQTGTDLMTKLAEVIYSWMAKDSIDYVQLSTGTTITADNAAEWETKLPY
ncbi:MAG: sugar ABC transporter substrate-binding protein [Spirochaetales bacterium]|nr:sugar ABC transporter substrate-binding protein [Spirochaetales bacterium]